MINNKSLTKQTPTPTHTKVRLFVYWFHTKKHVYIKALCKVGNKENRNYISIYILFTKKKYVGRYQIYNQKLRNVISVYVCFHFKNVYFYYWRIHTKNHTSIFKIIFLCKKCISKYKLQSTFMIVVFYVFQMYVKLKNGKNCFKRNKFRRKACIF